MISIPILPLQQQFIHAVSFNTELPLPLPSLLRFLALYLILAWTSDKSLHIMSLSNKLAITDVDLKDKRVLIRVSLPASWCWQHIFLHAIECLSLSCQVDFNVPLDSDKKVTNNQRIVGAVPTIKYAIDHGAKAVILMSHLGRPDGKANPKYSLKPVIPELEKLLGRKVVFTDDCVGPQVEETVNKASGGEVILLENLRFHIEEEGSSKDADGKKIKADKGDVEKFRKGLTALGDVYISTVSTHNYSDPELTRPR